eukprot:2479611-Rhodomonas_salina.1
MPHTSHLNSHAQVISTATHTSHSNTPKQTNTNLARRLRWLMSTHQSQHAPGEKAFATRGDGVRVLPLPDAQHRAHFLHALGYLHERGGAGAGWRQDVTVEEVEEGVGRVGESWGELGRVGESWGEAGRVGESWG